MIIRSAKSRGGPRQAFRILLLMAGGLAAGCTNVGEIRTFASDGCSLFPNRSLINGDDWCGCCLEHDIAYWKGGSEAERLMADEALRQCVLEQTGDEALARLMFEGVRLGGVPWLPTWYRWGYGWSLDRGYRSLSPAEEVMAAARLSYFFRDHPEGPCGRSADGEGD